MSSLRTEDTATNEANPDLVRGNITVDLLHPVQRTICLGLSRTRFHLSREIPTQIGCGDVTKKA